MNVCSFNFVDKKEPNIVRLFCEKLVSLVCIPFLDNRF